MSDIHGTSTEKSQSQSESDLLKKRLWHRYFPVNLAKFLRTPFLQKTSGRLQKYGSHQNHFRGALFKRCCGNLQKFIGQNPSRRLISIKLQSNFIKITLRHECSVNLLDIFRLPFPKNNSGGLLLFHRG